MGIIEVVRTVLKDETIDVNWRDANGWSALHLACLLNRRDVAELLLDHGADIELPGSVYKRTPLICACVKGSVSTAMLLLDRGANANAQSKNGFTPLHNACFEIEMANDRNKIVEELLAHGADPNIENEYRETPLMAACIEERVSTVKLLLDHGADIESLDNIQDVDGKTELDLVKEKASKMVVQISMESSLVYSLQRKVRKKSNNGLLQT